MSMGGNPEGGGGGGRGEHYIKSPPPPPPTILTLFSCELSGALDLIINFFFLSQRLVMDDGYPYSESGKLTQKFCGRKKNECRSPPPPPPHILNVWHSHVVGRLVLQWKQSWLFTYLLILLIIVDDCHAFKHLVIIMIFFFRTAVVYRLVELCRDPKQKSESFILACLVRT